MTDAPLYVIKIGSKILADPCNGIHRPTIDGLVDQISVLRRHGRRVLLVSSGATLCGRTYLPTPPHSVIEKQAAAAMGQIDLVHAYKLSFLRHQIPVGQVLLSRRTLSSQTQKRNVDQTLSVLLSLGAVPIINQNDSVSIDELIEGDNDQLSALVAAFVRADLLVLLSDVDGLFDRNPKTDPSATLISTVSPSDNYLSFSDDTKKTTSNGGMSSKLNAAHMAQKNGISTLIGHGRSTHILTDLLNDIYTGTLITHH